MLRPYKLAKSVTHNTDSACETYLIHVPAYAKKANPGIKFVLVNEFVCNRLASAIYLPVPPGFILNMEDAIAYACLDFNLADVKLPPVIPSDITKKEPSLCAGVVAFDIWIRNGDRHTGNLHYDEATKRMEVFDHSHALLGPGDKVAYLDEANLGVAKHCLVPHLTDLESTIHWIDRIKAIPEYYIESTVSMSVPLGMPPESVKECIQALLNRRENLVKLIKENVAVFTAAKDQLTFGTTDHA